MDADRAAQTFAELFPALYRRFCRQIAPRAYEPSREALAILQHLTDAGPLTVTEAAQHMQRSQAAMSELLQRLVARGLLARLPDTRDRRRKLVWLTPAGQGVLAEARRVLSTDLLAAALQQLRPRQRRTLIESTRMLLQTQPLSGDRRR
jgi:DNA-binding MarR family transcriptional regulator